jgi:hypothetical protein
MDKKPAILLLVFCIVTIPATSVFATEEAHENLLWDGFVLNGVEGRVSSADTQHGAEWFFEFDTDVSDLRVKAPAGTKLKILPSLTLEKLIANADGHTGDTYRLSGWVTKYKGENFIFPNYFLPVSIRVRQQLPAGQTTKSETKQETAADSDDMLAMPEEIRERLSDQRIVRPRTSRQETEEKTRKTAGGAPEKETEKQSVVSDSDDMLTMPKEIRKRLSDRRIVRPRATRQTPEKKIDVRRDTVLVNRSAFLAKRKDGQLSFVLSAFGRNTRPVSLRLLPCEVLELTEHLQSAIPEPVRFKIAGVVTKYKGEDYLLLQKAVRTYSYGNFAR